MYSNSLIILYLSIVKESDKHNRKHNKNPYILSQSGLERQRFAGFVFFSLYLNIWPSDLASGFRKPQAKLH